MKIYFLFQEKETTFTQDPASIGVLYDLISLTPYHFDAVISIPVLQMRKLRLKEACYSSRGIGLFKDRLRFHPGLTANLLCYFHTRRLAPKYRPSSLRAVSGYREDGFCTLSALEVFSLEKNPYISLL